MSTIVRSVAPSLVVLLCVNCAIAESFSSQGTVSITGGGPSSALGRLDQIEIGTLSIVTATPDDGTLVGGTVEVDDFQFNPDSLQPGDSVVPFVPTLYVGGYRVFSPGDSTLLLMEADLTVLGMNLDGNIATVNASLSSIDVSDAGLVSGVLNAFDAAQNGVLSATFNFGISDDVLDSIISGSSLLAGAYSNSVAPIVPVPSSLLMVLSVLPLTAGLSICRRRRTRATS